MSTSASAVPPSDATPPRASLPGLPAELCNRIYHLALVSDSIFLSRAPYGAPPALARANCQLRAEILPIYYGQNNFSGYATSITDFLARLPADQAAEC